ncbi:GntR family transcriptional regulator [Aquaspirillum soli]
MLKSAMSQQTQLPKPDYQPLYAQIHHHLASRIAQGEWQPHEALPSEWDLADALGVSQGTVRKALTDLVRDGWLYRQQGRGTFVAPSLSEWGGADLVSPLGFTEQAERPIGELIGCSKVNAADEIAEGLGLRRGAPVYRIRKLWRLEGVPIAMDDAYCPVEPYPGIDARQLRQHEGSLYQLLERQHAMRVRFRTSLLRAVIPGREDLQLLRPEDGTAPMLAIIRIAESWSGEAVEWRYRLCRCTRWAYRPSV